MKKMFSFFTFCILITLIIVGCGKKAEVIDYADEKAFEEALNKGENLEGKIVTFTATEIHPDSALGFNVWAGEHLNFVSSRNPDIKQGDVVTVRANVIENNLDSWVIQYDKVSGAVIGDTTIASSKESLDEGSEEQLELNGASDIEEQGDNITIDGDTEDTNSLIEDESEKLPLEIVESGFYLYPFDDSYETIYFNFIIRIYNPNKDYIANSPKGIVTVKNAEGSILATESQSSFYIMPEDTITIVGLSSLQKADYTDDAQIFYDIEWSDMTIVRSNDSPRTTDFEVSNVSERENSNEGKISGEITNNFTYDIDSVNVSIILRKDNQIVYAETTFVDGLKVGKAKAFEVSQWGGYPDHDTIDIYVQKW